MKILPVFAVTTVLMAMSMIAACVPQTPQDQGAAAEQVAVHPESGLDVIPLSVTSGTLRHIFQVEVAASSAEQAKGLMFRTKLGPNEGMIFPKPSPGIARFWMKNTPLSLDIIFIGPDGRIVNIAANTVPYSLESVNSAGPTSTVFEIRGGRAAELGIKAGDLVEY